MSFPFFTFGAKKRDRIVAIDLGTRTTKAISLERSHDRYRLVNYVIQDAPAYEGALSADLLAEHLKRVTHQLEAKTKQVILVAGIGDSLIRHSEMPLVPVSDMRTMLKLNSKTYLQQDLSGYAFDCYIMPPRPGTAAASKASQKCRVIVGGAKQPYVDTLQAAAKAAGLVVEEIVPGLVGAPNAFEKAESEAFFKEVIALVDLGFKHSSISILELGDLMLNRVVAIGGDRLTQGLAEAMNISYAEAEGIKIGMPHEVASNLQPLIVPLGRELRVSIDFFEHQQDKTVSQVYVSGAAAHSSFIVDLVQAELTIPCKAWNPTSFLDLALSPQRREDMETIAPQLAVAVGAAASIF